MHALLLFSQGVLNVGQVVSLLRHPADAGLPHLDLHVGLFADLLGLAGARRILELMNRENNPGPERAGFCRRDAR